MNVREIAEIVETLCPQSFAMERDNVGLLAGDWYKDVKRVLVCCDVDEFVAKEAYEKGADMIISHHPLMFNPIRRLNEDNPEQRTLRLIVKNDIALYAAHTNLDVARGGLNDYMAFLLGLSDTQVIEHVCDYNGAAHGYGRFARLAQPVTLRDMLNRCMTVFDLDGCRYVGDFDDKISTVAVNTGGGAGIMDLCFELGADLFITGEVKYNPARDSYERGMDLIDVAHYDTEKITMDFFRDFFAKRAPQIDVVKSEANRRIFKVYA